MRNEKSKSPLVLMEQVIMLVVFALAAAICVRAFVQADFMSKKLYATDCAVLLCQTAAEVLKAENGDYKEVVRRLTDGETEGVCTDEGIRIYYSTDWEPVEEKVDSGYALYIEETESKTNVICAEVKVLSVKDGTMLYGLPVSRQEVAHE